MITHDRQFIANIANRILSIENQDIHIFEGSYEAFKSYIPQEEPNSAEEELLRLETKITEVLGKLSLEPSEELDHEFQMTLTRCKERITE